jgi:(S)-2-hydroxyglutarate dehydrogenase
MSYDIIIIGGGIVGLATALKLKSVKPGLKILVLEKEAHCATHQTGNNSGVIHSGIYYKPGSLKAVNCINGYHELVKFCEQENIPYELCGKLIIASGEEELPVLEGLYQNGILNGLDRIRRVSKKEIPFFEPYAGGISAIHVPYTGIVDYREVSRKMVSILREKMEVNILTSARVTDIQPKSDQIEIVTTNGNFRARLFINTAGLHSDHIALLDGIEPGVRIIPFRGEYFELHEDCRHLVKNLIYPVPDPAFPFLGVHLTRRINGSVEAGPNAVFAFGREAYKRGHFSVPELFESLRWNGFRKVMRKYWRMGFGEYYRSLLKNAFAHRVRNLIPEIKSENLKRGGAGVRAQACALDGKLLDDFLIHESRFGLHVLNAPSPAATASLAIGATIANRALIKLE